ncbi:YkgJ family cysteine cluster protein [Pontibacter rugosus]|uniref:YkgJ family cysteine cluster protein n=1 Tax=Pontibacter rugosus TaxID=1745966 RepID=A0ABW3SRW6_9BACT
MNDITNVCLSCGSCCDGTLIGFVQLEREELPVLTELMDIENADGEGFFLQPCNNYCNGCTIYDSRPKQCAKFLCGLLTSLERKEVDLNSALEIVKVVKQKRIAIEEKLALLQVELQSPSFHFKMVELKKLLQKNELEATLTHDQIDLLADIEQLDSLLLDKFGVSLL